MSPSAFFLSEKQRAGCECKGCRNVPAEGYLWVSASLYVPWEPGSGWDHSCTCWIHHLPSVSATGAALSMVILTEYLKASSTKFVLWIPFWPTLPRAGLPPVLAEPMGVFSFHFSYLWVPSPYSHTSLSLLFSASLHWRSPSSSASQLSCL